MMAEDTNRLAEMFEDAFPEEARQRRQDEAKAEARLKEHIQRLEAKAKEPVPDDFHWYAEGVTEDPEQAEIFRQQGCRIQCSDELRALRKRLAELAPTPRAADD